MKTTLFTGLTVLAVSAFSADAQRIGLNFTDGWPTPMLAGETSDGCSNWYDSVANYNGGAPNDVKYHGTVTFGGLTATWASANTWAAGQEINSEQQQYRVYLDDGDGGSSLVGGDGIGVSVTISGLAAYMAANNMTSYQLRTYSSSDTTGGSFQPVSVRSGAPNAADGANQLLNLAVITSFSVPVLGDGAFPTGTSGNSIRGYGDSVWLTDDVITLTIPSRGGSIRGTLAGLQVIPEPSSLAVLGLGLVGLVAARARKG